MPIVGLIVQLASPMYHVGFVNEVYKLLQCVCYSCSKIRGLTKELVRSAMQCIVSLVPAPLRGRVCMEVQLSDAAVLMLMALLLPQLLQESSCVNADGVAPAAIASGEQLC